MAASSSTPIKVLEVCHVSPSLPNPHEEFSLPLTFFDVYWLKFHPVERLFYYEIRDLSTGSFLDSIFPNLKDSLSIALSHFLPLAATLTWPAQVSKPFLHYSPGDAVLLTVAESTAADQFDILSGDGDREAIECRSLVPQLHVSDAKASSIALQVTVFPNKGLCIGISTHHAVVDGKSSTLFMKAWAHICNELSLKGKDSVSLSQELTPIINRDVIKDPAGIDTNFLDFWTATSKVVNPNSDPKSLKIVIDRTEFPEILRRCTFRLTRTDISTLRRRVCSWQEKLGREMLHVSTFCITCAHVLVCMLRAIGFEDIKRAYLVFAADFRRRLDPPVPTNYVGNCVWGGLVELEPEYCTREDGMSILAEKINDAVKGTGAKELEGAGEWIWKIGDIGMDSRKKKIGLAGSPRFEVYKTDYGWGRPKKVEIVSVDRSGAIAMAENNDESGGIQLGIVLDKAQMEVFASEFHGGLRNSP